MFSLEIYNVNNYTNNFDSLSKQFNLDVKEVVRFISNSFSKIKIDGVRGIRIDLNTGNPEEGFENPITGYPICRVTFPYDYVSYLKLDKESRKEEIIKILKKGINRTCDEMGWDKTELFQTFLQCVEKERFDYVFLKAKNYTGLKTKAYVECEVQPGFNNYYIVVVKPSNETVKKKIVTLNGYYNLSLEKSRILSEIKWVDPNTILIIGTKGHLERINFEYKLDTGTFTTNFNLEPDIKVKEFMEEFDLATTEDPEKIDRILNNRDVSKWHIYI